MLSSGHLQVPQLFPRGNNHFKCSGPLSKLDHGREAGALPCLYW